MPDGDRSVFISYRRNTSAFMARAIFMDLRAHGYDVFMDVESIDAGTFDTILLNQIAARAHFVLVLTPGSVERFADPEDWVRREIERALDLKRNIVPVATSNFDFNEAQKYFTGKLEEILRFNAVVVPHDYFDAAMQRLRSRFLKPLDTDAPEVTPTPDEEQEIVQKKVRETTRTSSTIMVLNTEMYFVRAYAKFVRGDYPGALRDYTKAIETNPMHVQAFYNRGDLHKKMGDLDAALADYNEAIRLNPDQMEAYVGRGQVYFEKRRYDLALADFQYANELQAAFSHAIAGIAIALHALKQYDEAYKLWRSLVNAKNNYADPNWVKERLNWNEPLAQEAAEIIAEIQETPL
jgi:tetratricopeptide (TPR) repeat protein